MDILIGYPRCIEPRSVSNRMSLDSDDHGNGKVSDGNRYHHQKVNACTSEEISEATETFNKADKVVACQSNSCLTETEFSFGDRSHFSPSPTCSESDIKASKEGVHYDTINLGIKTKQGDRKHYLRHRSAKFEDVLCK